MTGRPHAASVAAPGSVSKGVPGWVGNCAGLVRTAVFQHPPVLALTPPSPSPSPSPFTRWRRLRWAPAPNNSIFGISSSRHASPGTLCHGKNGSEVLVHGPISAVHLHMFPSSPLPGRAGGLVVSKSRPPPPRPHEPFGTLLFFIMISISGLPAFQSPHWLQGTFILDVPSHYSSTRLALLPRHARPENPHHVAHKQPQHPLDPSATPPSANNRLPGALSALPRFLHS